jgi:peptide/nickel transport system substrate-binding protein
MAVEISCPFAPTSKAYDPNLKPWPFDLLQARRLLAEEGWYDSDGDGILDKEIDGKRVPFRFRLTYYVKNEISKAIGEYIATALKELSITCDLQGVDIADLSSIFDDKSFEALMLAWSMGSPPEDPKQLWHSSEAKLKGSSNAIGFANKDADALIDALQYEADPMKRQQLYRRFDAIIHEEAPYTFLYAPKTTLLYRDRVQNVFIPTDRPDLIPDADIAQPSSSLYWLKT